MNYIFIIIITLLIIFWVINDLFHFFEFFNAGICTTSDGTYGNYYDNKCNPFSDSTAPSNNRTYIDGNNEKDLLKYADTAMYRAKKNGKNSFEFFEDYFLAYADMNNSSISL